MGVGPKVSDSISGPWSKQANCGGAWRAGTYHVVDQSTKRFTEPHTFGRRGAAKKSGWEVPMTDIAMQIEKVVE
jgi:hypothetical protein